jgi:DNA-binding response OmpR family regulator
MPLLETTNAGWLILDIELEDGYSTEVIPDIAAKYGSSIFIITLTGYWNRFQENLLFSMGVDMNLRKPYPAQGLLWQVNKAKTRLFGGWSDPNSSIVLQIGDGRLDLETGTFIDKDGDRIDLPETQLKLMQLLASERKELGWRWVSRGEILLHIWGDTAEMDVATAGQRLRKLMERIRDIVPEKEIINVSRTRSHSSRYCLSNKVTIVDSGDNDA